MDNIEKTKPAVGESNYDARSDRSLLYSMEVTTVAPPHHEPVDPAAACVWWDGSTVNVEVHNRLQSSVVTLYYTDTWHGAWQLVHVYNQ